jgi:hypothetical protein
MAIALQLSSLDGVDEAVKGLYVEKDGVFALDISGMPEIPDVTGLKTALASEREASKLAKAAEKAALANLDGVDLEQYRSIMAKFDGDEELKLMAEGKTDEVWNKRKEKSDVEWQRKLDAELTHVQAEREINAVLKQRALQGELSLSFADTFHEFGKRDAIRVAGDLFSLNDDGKAVMVDGDGNIVIGKDGSTPFSPAEWANSDDTRKANPHWFNASGGGSGLVQGTANNGQQNDMSGLSRVERMQRQLELNSKKR